MILGISNSLNLPQFQHLQKDLYMPPEIYKDL